MTRRTAVHVIALIGLFGSARPVWAQRDTGSIVGTVRDSSGAVVPGATVTVAEVTMGLTFVTTTSNSGDFVASPLRIGRYKVRVGISGFKTAEVGPFTLSVQERQEVNITLQVGGVGEEVIVRAEAPILETQTSELGQVI
ncbi:MAG TPA: carboxypeptidase-like regulatory domain-containing protein, partial [Vicinamibacteria bacterium]|nr:carboxypeptidase-like regulatory domain-containing protein [Vicinamibacteria bacterium]